MTQRQQQEINRAAAKVASCMKKQKAAGHEFSQTREDTRRAIADLQEAVTRARGKAAAA